VGESIDGKPKEAFHLRDKVHGSAEMVCSWCSRCGVGNDGASFLFLSQQRRNLRCPWCIMD